MAGLAFVKNRKTKALSTADITAPLSQGAGTIWGQHTLGSGMVDFVKKEKSRFTDPNRIDTTKAKELIGDLQIPLSAKDLQDGDKGDLSRAYIESVVKDKKAELRRGEILSRTRDDLANSAAQLGTGFAATLTDPAEIAISLVPVVGQTKYAAALAKAGSAGSRALVRAKAGALGGAVGTALAEPIMYGLAKNRNEQYTIQESLTNIAFGTILGGGLHVSGGAIKDKLRGPAKNPIDVMVDSIIGVESGGRADAKNPNSTATGPGQFIESTWLNTLEKHRPDLIEGKSRDEILAMRTDPVIGKEMTTRFTEDNAKVLRGAGKTVDAESLYLLHHFGEEGGLKMLDADAATPVSTLLSKAALKANPYLKDLTVGQLKANHTKRLKKFGAKNQKIEEVVTDGPPERITPTKPIERTIDDLSPATREASLNTAFNQMGAGRQINIESILEADPRYNYFKAKRMPEGGKVDPVTARVDAELTKFVAARLPDEANISRVPETKVGADGNVTYLMNELPAVAQGNARLFRVASDSGVTPFVKEIKPQHMPDKSARLEYVDVPEGTTARVSEASRARNILESDDPPHPDQWPPSLRGQLDRSLAKVANENKAAAATRAVANAERAADFDSHSDLPNRADLAKVDEELKARMKDDDVMLEEGLADTEARVANMDKTPEMEAELAAIDKQIDLETKELGEVESKLNDWVTCRITNG